MRHHLALVLVSCSVLFACGDDESGGGEPATDADRVFAASSSGTANGGAIEGIWEAKVPRVQAGLESAVRIELRADHVVAAARCTPSSGGDATTVGKTAKATVSSAAIDVPEDVRASKELGAATCAVLVRAGNLGACDLRKPVAERTSCFELAKGVLTVRDEVTSVDYVKIAD